MTDAPYRMWGDIVLDPSVAIAPGSFLLVEPGCQLRIAPGACIGAGCLIHVFGGDLEIDGGAIVGSAVLLVGSGKIGAKACIGAAATLVNPTVEAGHMVHQNSFHGSLGFDGAVDLGFPEEMAVMPPAVVSHPVTQAEVGSDAAPAPDLANTQGVSEVASSANGVGSNGVSSHGVGSQSIASQVYGLDAFYRLMAMLFPHRDFPSGLSPMSAPPPTPSTHHQPEGGEVR